MIYYLPELLSGQKPSFNRRLEVRYYHKDKRPDGALLKSTSRFGVTACKEATESDNTRLKSS